MVDYVMWKRLYQGDKINDDHSMIAGLHVPTFRACVRFVNLNYVLTLIAALREEMRSNLWDERFAN